jgi:hypothetical protein
MTTPRGEVNAAPTRETREWPLIEGLRGERLFLANVRGADETCARIQTDLGFGAARFRHNHAALVTDPKKGVYRPLDNDEIAIAGAMVTFPSN